MGNKDNHSNWYEDDKEKIRYGENDAYKDCPMFYLPPDYGDSTIYLRKNIQDIINLLFPFIKRLVNDVYDNNRFRGGAEKVITELNNFFKTICLHSPSEQLLKDRNKDVLLYYLDLLEKDIINNECESYKELSRLGYWQRANDLLFLKLRKLEDQRIQNKFDEALDNPELKTVGQMRRGNI